MNIIKYVHVTKIKHKDQFMTTIPDLGQAYLYFKRVLATCTCITNLLHLTHNNNNNYF